MKSQRFYTNLGHLFRAYVAITFSYISNNFIQYVLFWRCLICPAYFVDKILCYLTKFIHK